MLTIEQVGGQHIPRALGEKMESAAGAKVTRLTVREKRERKERFLAIEDEDASVPLGHRIGRLLGKNRDFGLGGNAETATIRAIFPVVERAPDCFADNTSLSQVGVHV
jgi:hypothetical protein